MPSDESFSFDGLENTIGTAEVAKRKGVSRHAVLRWARNGLLKSVHLPYGGGYRFNPADVDAFEPPLPGNPDWRAKGQKEEGE